MTTCPHHFVITSQSHAHPMIVRCENCAEERVNALPSSPRAYTTTTAMANPYSWSNLLAFNFARRQTARRDIASLIDNLTELHMTFRPSWHDDCIPVPIDA